MLSSAAIVLVVVAASQIVGLTAAPLGVGIAVNGALGRNGKALAVSFEGDEYLRSCSSVACHFLQIEHETFAQFGQLLAWWFDSKQWKQRPFANSKFILASTSMFTN